MAGREGSREIYEEHSTAINIAGSQGQNSAVEGNKKGARRVKLSRCGSLHPFLLLSFNNSQRSVKRSATVIS